MRIAERSAASSAIVVAAVGFAVAAFAWFVARSVSSSGDALAPAGEAVPLLTAALAGLLAVTAMLAGLLVAARAAVGEAKRAEALLRETERRASDERTRRVIESALDAVIVLDARGVVTGWNPRAHTKFGLSVEEAIGRRLGELLQPEEGHSGEPLDARLARGDVTLLNRRLEVEGRRNGADGRFDAELAITEIGCDEASRYAAFVRDISDRKREEQRRRERESRLSARNAVLADLSRSRAIAEGDVEQAMREITTAAARMIDVERVGVWIYDESRTTIRCLDQYETTAEVHRSGAELRATEFPRYFAALEEGRIVAAHDVRADPRTSEFLSCYLIPNDIHSMMDALVRVHGRAVGIICHEQTGSRRRWSPEDQAFAGAMADLVALTLQARERRAAQEALRVSERSLRQIIDLVPHLVFAKDRAGRFILANRAVAEAHGTTVEALVGAPLAEVHAVRGEVERMLGDDREVIERGEAKFVAEEVFTDSAGRQRILQTTKIPFTAAGRDEPAVLGVAIDITDRRKAEQRQRLMVRELDHRVKNNLSAVLAIAEETVLNSPTLEAFRTSFTGRVRSLKVAHELLAQTSWDGAELRGLVERLVEPFDPDARARFDVEGAPVLLPAAVAPPLCMVIHELLTNAIKYGSLSTPGGRVSLRWGLVGPLPPAVGPLPPATGSSGPAELFLYWEESGGPIVGPPGKRGFGTELIEQMIVYQVHGDARLTFPPDGVRCTMRVPLPLEATSFREVEECVSGRSTHAPASTTGGND